MGYNILMNAKRHLFLDLEDTLITPVVEGWECSELINVGKIKSVIDSFRPDHVSIFSFAIWNERERLLFAKHARPMIERALGVKLSMVPTVDDDIISACCAAQGISRKTVTFSDASDFWGKQQAFRLWCWITFGTNWERHGIKNDVFLLDDAVFNEEFNWPDLRVTGQIKNIDKLT